MLKEVSMRKLSIALAGFVFAAATVVSAHAAVKGDYIEVRSADVYTGPCFANSEVGLEGKQAILAWRVRQGDWRGVNLDGLSVVAVVRANATLGDPYHNPYPAKSILIVDERASSEQRQALMEFAKSAAGPLTRHVARVMEAPIRVEVGEGANHGSVKMVAGNLARIETRSLCLGDHICGNEDVYYPPLTKVSHAMPAFTLQESFSGQGLDTVWSRQDTRSAFVGSFAL
jgi:hypothetical protein